MQRITAGEIEAVFEHWMEVMESPRSKLDSKRREAIQARLRDGYSLSDLCDAINGCRASRFHMGENDRHRRYNDIALICRDAEHLDSFIETWEEAVRRADGFSADQSVTKPLSQMAPEEKQAARDRMAQVLQLSRRKVAI